MDKTRGRTGEKLARDFLLLLEKILRQQIPKRDFASFRMLQICQGLTDWLDWPSRGGGGGNKRLARKKINKNEENK